MQIVRKFSVLVSALVVATAALANAASVSPAPSVQHLPSAVQIVAALKASEISNKTPKGIINPPLTAPGLFWTSVNAQTGIPNKVGCIINDAATDIPSDVSTSCAFGDTASATTIALVGDSNANAWIPAFDTWGYVNHVKVVAVVHAACAPWNRPWLPKDRPIWGDITERKCATWRSSMVTKINSLRATKVFAVGIATTDKQLVFPSQRTLEASMIEMVKKFGSSKTAFIEPVPQFSLASAVLSCVTAHGTNLRACSISRSEVTGSFMNRVIKSVAVSQKISVVATQNLFCGVTVCPIFSTIGGTNYLIYEDGYHISHQYSQIIGTSLAIRAALK